VKDGFVKVAAVSPFLRVADCENNALVITKEYEKAANTGVKLIVFPEMSVTAYTVGELVRQRALLKSAENAVLSIRNATKGYDTVAVIGFPFVMNGSVYNCAAVIQNGSVLGIVPKTTVGCYGDNYDARYFAEAPAENTDVFFGGEIVPFGAKQIFVCEENEEIAIGVEFESDLLSVKTPSCDLALNGATVIACLAASSELVGRAERVKASVKAHSDRIISAYIYANAGMGESSSDGVYSGHSLIAENGSVLAEGKPFTDGITVTDIDVQRLTHDRMKNTAFKSENDYETVYFSMEQTETALVRSIAKNPFMPCENQKNERCAAILDIQAQALARRVSHVRAKKIVVGISGGLDSCLALLVMVRAMDLLGRDRKDILAVTMPCFGTTERTKSNAEKLCEELGVTFKEVNIAKAVTQHFEDIGQDKSNYDVAYENAQARERTQVLMDIANQEGGIVIGTGDLSELALGWATYNGDHMSMYSVNCSVPKTLVRLLVRYYADNCGSEALKASLCDILGTPVSPELIPPKESGEISQITEDLVGPYELHDFFIYYFVRYGFTAEKIFRLAIKAFDGAYDGNTVRKWLSSFFRRFVTQQFKRSCSPDGPRVGSVALTPNVWKMPSDAEYNVWKD